jgi:hypothetical protein
VSLVLVGFSLLRTFGMFNFKSAGSGGQFLIILATAPTAILLLLVAFRLVGVVIGKFKLNVAATSGALYGLRMLAIFLMVASVSVAAYGFVGVLTSSRSDGAGYILMSGILGGGSPIGPILFEASRILERELLIDSAET